MSLFFSQQEVKFFNSGQIGSLDIFTLGWI